MSFAARYLQRHQFCHTRIENTPDPELGIVVVIPCYNEPDVLKTLESLWNCSQPSCSVEIIVVINSAENAAENIKRQNLKTLGQIREWKTARTGSGLDLNVSYYPDLPKKHAGAGLARKIGMDEAVRRFEALNRPDGIIASLDADTLCEQNYFTEIEKQFRLYPGTDFCTVYFEHPVEGNEFPATVYRSIILYELYLRYYTNALRYTGFPYTCTAIGSAMVVRASAYTRVGGMNRKQAGEDFYFLQKLMHLGHFHEINSTKIIPSPRPSDRVPFGTGPVVAGLSQKTDPEYKTYNLKAFTCLKLFFEKAEQLYDVRSDGYNAFIAGLPECIGSFLEVSGFQDALAEIRSNCASPGTFRKRFFRWFNAFRVLKYLNHSHQTFYRKESVVTGAGKLLREFGKPDVVPGSAEELLAIYRHRDRLR